MTESAARHNAAHRGGTITLTGAGISGIDAAGALSAGSGRHALPARGELAVPGKAPLPSLQTVLSRGRRLNGGHQSRQGSEDHDDLSKPLHLLTSSSNRPAATDVLSLK
jgi:hypothetical protein